jgi:transposase
MRRDVTAMSQKQRQKYHLLKMVVESKITLKQASSVIGVSYRHGKRLKRKLATEGARGLVHGNRGRPSPRTLNGELAQRIIALSRKTGRWFQSDLQIFLYLWQLIRNGQPIDSRRGYAKKPRHIPTGEYPIFRTAI